MAVLIPCLNEEITVAGVVRDFAKALPDATIYVFDNNSTDRTAELAREAGATVVFSPQRGKGNVVRHIQRTVDADIYVMADGDGTYLASAAPQLIERMQTNHIDMLIASRLDQFDQGSFRKFHHWGNHLISGAVSMLFSSRVTDVLSGYRVMSRELLKLVRIRSGGFEVETEMTLQALAKQFRVEEVPVEYGRRPEGSHSKLNTWGDGLLILRSLFSIFKDYRPRAFFSVAALVLMLASLAAGIAPVLEFFDTGLVTKLPRAVLAAGLATLATISLAVGLILDTISKYHEETFNLWRQQIAELDAMRSQLRQGRDRE